MKEWLKIQQEIHQKNDHHILRFSELHEFSTIFKKQKSFLTLWDVPSSNDKFPAKNNKRKKSLIFFSVMCRWKDVEFGGWFESRSQETARHSLFSSTVDGSNDKPYIKKKKNHKDTVKRNTKDTCDLSEEGSETGSCWPFSSGCGRGVWGTRCSQS